MKAKPGPMLPDRFRRLRSALERRQPDLTVLMERVSKSHNFSAIVRNCDAVGVMDVHVVPPRSGLDLHHGISAGTRKWVGVHRHRTVEQAVATLHAAGFQVLAAHRSPDAVDFREADFTVPTAVMVGAELDGVSEQGLALADRKIAIPMMGLVQSLNVSVAAALMLYEAYAQRERAGMYEQSRLPAADLEKRIFEWAYPSLASRRRREGRPYPGLDADGGLLPD